MKVQVFLLLYTGQRIRVRGFLVNRQTKGVIEYDIFYQSSSILGHDVEKA